MSKIQWSSVSDAAASPNHPDHARWVKERTLAMEAEHAARIGATFRDAETVNARNLERLEARKRARRQKQTVLGSTDPRSKLTREERHQARGVTVKPAPIIKAPKSPCNFCGQCLNCKRQKRVYEILNKAKLGDLAVMRLAWKLTSISLSAQLRKGMFAEMSRADRGRAFYAMIDKVCDESVRLLGAWR